MCVRSMEECECDCHENENVRHVMPCCATCPWCKKRIRHAFSRDHVADCRAERRKRSDELARRTAMDSEEAWEAVCERLGIDPH